MAKSVRRVKIFSALEVANICGVVNQTAINWIRSGHLKAFTTPGGQYRVYAKDLAAFLEKRGMADSGETLRVMMENANWNCLLIAADKSMNNDNLKARIENILPDYHVIQAVNWFEIGRKVTEKKPGFILLDEALSGVDISDFINTIKEDPVFGRPFIFLLTGGSSVYMADMIFNKPLDLGKLGAAVKGFEKQQDIISSA